MVFGDMDSASDRVLHCGAELVVHAYRDGARPGATGSSGWGLDYKVLPARRGRARTSRCWSHSSEARA